MTPKQHMAQYLNLPAEFVAWLNAWNESWDAEAEQTIKYLYQAWRAGREYERAVRL